MATEHEKSFTLMYHENYADLLRFVRRRMHPLAADDVVSETFTVAWRRRDQLPTPVRPWLFRTARNVMLNSGRGYARQKAVAVRIAENFSEHSDTDFNALEQRLDLVVAWKNLPDADQEVLALDVWEEMSAHDAAAVLGCSRGAYAMRLTRARRRLAALFRASESFHSSADSVTHLPATGEPYLFASSPAPTR